MKRHFILFAFVPLVVSSCMVFHSGSISSGPLLNATDKYVDMARGEARSSLFLGVGATYNRKLIFEAKNDLYRRYPLKNGEYYSNFSTEIAKKIFFGIVYIVDVEVNADILKGQDTSSTPLTETFKRRAGIGQTLKNPESINYNKTSPNKKVLKEGELVYYAHDNKNYKLFKVSTVDKESVMLIATNQADANLLAPLEKDFFIKDRELEGFKNGDAVTAETINEYNSTVYEDGLVLGVDKDFFLVKTKSGFHVLPAIRLKHK